MNKITQEFLTIRKQSISKYEATLLKEIIFNQTNNTKGKKFSEMENKVKRLDQIISFFENYHILLTEQQIKEIQEQDYFISNNLKDYKVYPMETDNEITIEF